MQVFVNRVLFIPDTYTLQAVTDLLTAEGLTISPRIMFTPQYPKLNYLQIAGAGDFWLGPKGYHDTEVSLEEFKQLVADHRKSVETAKATRKHWKF